MIPRITGVNFTCAYVYILAFGLKQQALSYTLCSREKQHARRNIHIGSRAGAIHAPEPLSLPRATLLACLPPRSKRTLRSPVTVSSHEHLPGASLHHRACLSQEQSQLSVVFLTLTAAVGCLSDTYSKAHQLSVVFRTLTTPPSCRLSS